MNTNLREDVAAASAAYIFNLWSEICRLDDAQKFDRLKSVIETAIEAYEHGKQGWFEPSRN